MSKTLFNHLWAVLKDTVKNMKEAHFLMVASSLAYTTILWVIPALAIGFFIFEKVVGIHKFFETIDPIIIPYLAEGTGEKALQTLQIIVTHIDANAIGMSGIIILAITCMSMFSNIERSINRVWQSPESRHVLHRMIAYTLLIFIVPAALAMVSGIAKFFGTPVARIFSHKGIIILITFLFLSSIYKWVPNHKVRWAPVMISSLITTILINLAQSGFAFYTGTLSRHNLIYGSVAIIPISLIWIYILWLTILTGAALTSSLQKKNRN